MHWLFFGLIFFASNSFANDCAETLQVPAPESSPLSQIIQKMLNNVGAIGTAPGSVIASPSRANPNYFYHWIRDAALVMDTVVTLHRDADPETEADRREELEKKLFEYVRFSKKNQATKTLTSLGEPKFLPDGLAFDENWGRPQNDGPALRAITLIRFAATLVGEDRLDEVQKEFYNEDAKSLIKADLEYISHHWKDASFDYWEEIKGQHFATLKVQRKALIMGANLASLLKDQGAADFYNKQAEEIADALEKFWDPEKKIVKATLDPESGHKTSDLDIAVILGVLHGDVREGQSDEMLSVTDDRILATAFALTEKFKTLYPINKDSDAVLYGRYPEDTYDGYKTGSKGNPWFLASFAMAEFYYKLYARVYREGKIVLNETNYAFYESLLKSDKYRLKEKKRWTIADSLYYELVSELVKNADAILRRALSLAGPGQSLSEQIHFENGSMQGASDLTWSYASLLTATWARPKSKGF